MKIYQTPEVVRHQQYIEMMTGNDADLKPLVISCLEDDSEGRPLVTDISGRLKKMKEAYSKKKSYDGMNPISWLGEIKQTSLSTQLQVLFCRLLATVNMQSVK